MRHEHRHYSPTPVACVTLRVKELRARFRTSDLISCGSDGQSWSKTSRSRSSAPVAPNTAPDSAPPAKCPSIEVAVTSAVTVCEFESCREYWTYVDSPVVMYPGTLERLLSWLLRNIFVSQNLTEFCCFNLDVARSVMSTRRLPRGVTHHSANQQRRDSRIPKSFTAGTSQVVS